MFSQQAWSSTYGMPHQIWSMFASSVNSAASRDCYRADDLRHLLGELVGHGLVFVEGTENRRQCWVINPAFGPLLSQRFTETFVRRSNEMRDRWLDLCSRATTDDDGFVRVDCHEWLDKAALNITGLTGFDYDLQAPNSREDTSDALDQAVWSVFLFDVTLAVLLQLAVSVLRSFVRRAHLVLPPHQLTRAQSRKRVRELAAGKVRISEVGMRLSAEKKAPSWPGAADGGAAREKKGGEGGDLLGLLTRANLASDLPESTRLSDHNILAHIPTFLVAGHEITSTAVAWALYALVSQRDVQRKLRAELLASRSDAPSHTELDGLPYLDAVVREVLRLHPPVFDSAHVAWEGDVVPLNAPYTGAGGTDDKAHHELHASKDDMGIWPIWPTTVLDCAACWGEDVHQFRPERWLQLPEAVKEQPDVRSNQTAVVGGAHVCIGHRFIILEMKALLFAIVREFEFKLAVSSDAASRSQLPLLIRPVSAFEA